ncbi:putative tRNA ligase [Escherichia coli]|uniref:Putative tRNA ligase n=1 Tax=Escherichia coli TaxID=562 RepID=A0A377B138_ECOLX|nr:putative tRNA ligase [Escherichia coli]
MTDDGHANDLAGLYLTWHRSSPEEWKALIAGGSERGLIYTQFVAQTAMCCGEGGIKAWDYVRMGFLSRVGCAQQLADGRREFMAAIARLCTSSPLLSQLDALFFRLFVRTSLLAIFSSAKDNTSLREALTLYKYDSAGSRMFEELAAGSDRFYATLPWQPLTVQPGMPGNA